MLDEFPYLAHESPALPSIVQARYDRIGPGSATQRTPLRLVLCGSAISVMPGLLAGTKALRGRGALELRVKPFGFRDARNSGESTTWLPRFSTTPWSAARPGTANWCQIRPSWRTRR